MIVRVPKEVIPVRSKARECSFAPYNFLRLILVKIVISLSVGSSFIPCNDKLIADSNLIFFQGKTFSVIM